ncbi:MAG: transposase, partial [Pseudonocardiaceae bacterium]
AAVRAVYRRREPPLPVVVRDRLGEVFPDAEFAPGFGVRGRPGWSPGRLALVTVLQMAENLTDRQAADAIRDKISWKYALGLGLDDEGFDASVLSEFRTRVVEHGLEQRVLDLLLAALVEQELVAPGGKQRTDSTHVISAVRDFNRLELAGQSVRAALEAVAAVAPDWLPTVIDSPTGVAATVPVSIPSGCRPPRPSAPSWWRPTAPTRSDAAARDDGRRSAHRRDARPPRLGVGQWLHQNHRLASARGV